MKKTQFFLATLIWVALGSSVLAQTLPVEPVLQDFRNWTQTQGFAQADVQGLRVTDDYVTQHNQVRHLYLQQAYQGIGIVNSNAAIHVWKGKVVARHEKLIKGLAAKAASRQASLTATEALRKLSLSHNWRVPSKFEVQSIAKGVEQKGKFGPNEIAYEAIPFQLVYYAGEKGKLHLGWNFQVHTTQGQHYYNSIVDAQSGEILFEEDWVLKCNVQINHTHEKDAHMNLFEEEFMHGPRVNSLEEANMMTAQYRVLAIPTESPNHGPFVLVQDPADSIASPYGWHDTDGAVGPEHTITRGNNVWASEDRDGDRVSGYSPDGGANLNFDFIQDINLGPIQNQDVGITNLFYMNNIMHDVWYQYGFDEQSGNFQENNYGKGGIGNDAINARAQQGIFLGTTNNAIFYPAPDGGSGAIHMSIFLHGDVWTEGVYVNSPSSISGDIKCYPAAFGDREIANPITADLALANDGSGTTGACGPLVNGANVSGKIVLLTFGNCSLVEQALRVQNAGAVGVIFINFFEGPPWVIRGSSFSDSVTIPVFMISKSVGDKFWREFHKGINMTLTKPNLTPRARDSDLDNAIIAHEYGHGISHRLTGGPSEIGCLDNVEQPGEGWSDWFSLVMQVEPGDKGTDAVGLGTYAEAQPTNGPGIREYPYSTDMNVNPFTYNDIKQQVEYFDSTITSVLIHGVGSIMGTILWDLYWAMTDEYGYDPDIYQGSGGNNMAMQLVMDGMKLQPCSPGFVDVRDAILLADSINYGAANQRLIWEVFARRGLGASADQGSPFSISDGVEAFDIPDKVKEVLSMEKRVSKHSVENGDTLSFSFLVRNQKTTPLSNVIVRDTLANDFTYLPNSSTVNVSQSGQVLRLDLGDLAPKQDTTFSFQVLVNSNKRFTLPYFEDDMEGNISEYSTIGYAGNGGGWRTTTDNSFSPPTSWAWFYERLDTVNDQSLILPEFTLRGNPVLSFWHYYSTDTRIDGLDGGVVEILIDGEWIDLGEKMIVNGYNSGIEAFNPLGIRPGFTGKSNTWIQTKIDLSEFVNKASSIAFRFGSIIVFDEESRWYIDDIKVENEYAITNSARVTADEGDTYIASLEHPIYLYIPEIAPSICEPPHEVELNLFPNPAQHQVSLDYRGSSFEVLEIEFLNILGQRIKSFEIQPFIKPHAEQIDISTLPTGIYNVSIKQGACQTIKKLLVE